jgi:hypothetical protein
MQIIARQPELCPALPVVVGNVDYLEFKATLERIDQLLRDSGIQDTFVRHRLVEVERLGREEAQRQGTAYRPPSQKDLIRLVEHSVKALRCNIARTLDGGSCRCFSARLADSPLLQSFCQIRRLDKTRVPSKSTLDRYGRQVPAEFVGQVIAQLNRAASDGSAADGHPLGLEQPLSLEALLLDSTCVAANIHFPVDWVLLRDAARTLLKAVQVIRRHGLRHRMSDPVEFHKQVNRLCIAMTQSRRQQGGRKQRKQILRLLKKLLQKIDQHAQRHRDLLAQQWERTDLKAGHVRQILARLDGVRQQLPAAIRQAHERIIGGRQVANQDKILSLYEPDIHVIVRGKAGSEVEFGNTLLLAEQADGVIVAWQFFQDQAPSDNKLLAGVMKRFGAEYAGHSLGAVVGDRGFDNAANRKYLAEEKIYNAICPKSPVVLRARLQEERFVELQARRGQTEGRIGIFKNCFLGRPMRSKDFINRDLNITWSILTHNLWVIARLPLQEEQIHFRRAA